MGGATVANKLLEMNETKISIHAPRGGSDDGYIAELHKGENFNPRSPWGERLSRQVQTANAGKISIHAPRGGSDLSDLQSMVGTF